jgi:vacuolar-type H+-ATPase subunit I/STV1
MLSATRHDYSSIVQFDAKHNEAMRIIECERLKLQRIDSSLRAYAENKLIQLKEEEVRLQREKFEWDKLIVEEIQNFQKVIREDQRKKLQSEEDRHSLKLRANRDHIIKILSEDIGKLIIISSPPEVLRDDLQAFKSLEAEIQSKLTRTIEKYYGGVSQSVIGYRSNIFNDSISQTEASIVGESIASVPTLIFHSQVAYQKVFIRVTLTCPLVKEVAPQTEAAQSQFDIQVNRKTFVLPEWNWMEVKIVTQVVNPY